jgi:Domain of unknown function (DUF4357)
MNALRKSEERALQYLQKMFPGYVWAKTSGNGVLDFMGAPPPDSSLPMLFIESKMCQDRLRLSQQDFAKSDFGLRCRKYVIYSPTDSDDCEFFLYSFDDWCEFVEEEDLVARIERKSAERRAATEMAPGQYVIQQPRGSDRPGAEAKMHISEEGTVTVLQGSIFRKDEQDSTPDRTSELRKELIESGKLALRDGLLSLSEDHEFNSTSAAASAILGRSASGPWNWKPTTN